MAKPTTYAVPICLGLTLLALIGIALSVTQKNPIYAIVLLIPTVIYEVYRTEPGASTKVASWAMLGILILELIFLATGVSYNLANYFGAGDMYLGGFIVPLGDLKILAPAIIAVIALVLAIRTAGPFTKWLSIIIFVTVFAVIYTIDSESFRNLFRSAVQQIFFYF